MPTERKIKQVDEIKDRLSRCSITVATNPTSLNANDMNSLRRTLGNHEVEYRIVKNTLTYIAAEESEKPMLKQVVQGPTGLAFGYGDPRDVAKALQDFIRTTRSPLSILGGLLDQRLLTPEDIVTLSTLPSKPDLISKLLGQVQFPITRLVVQLQSPIVGLVNTLNGPLQGLGNVLRQRIHKLENQ